MNEKRNHLIVFLAVTLWVNASEVFRYFLIVMPAVREELASMPNVAPMDWSVFAIWGLWDTVLTVVILIQYFLVERVLGRSPRSVFAAGVLSWSSFFLLFWLGLVNMNLASWTLAAVALPLALLETTVACGIASVTSKHLTKSTA